MRNRKTLPGGGAPGDYPAPRPTWQAALLLALGLSLPAFAILTVVERIWM